MHTRIRVALGAAFISATLFCSMGATAHAETAPIDDTPPSSPASVSMSYAANIPPGRHGQLHKAERTIQNAGGVVMQRWPQIGVLIVHSSNPTFLSRVRAARNGAINSIGPTRTAPLPNSAAAASRRVPPGHRKNPAIAGYDAGPAPQGSSAPDPYESAQWGNVAVKADQANAITQGSRSVVVAVVDSGIEADHPDLAGQVDQSLSANCTKGGVLDTSPTGWLPATSGHGTHVAGIIAAARNGLGVVGVVLCQRSCRSYRF